MGWVGQNGSALIMTTALQWISTHFGRNGLQVPWELGSYVTKFTITLPNMVTKFRTCKRTSQVQRQLSNFSSY